MIAQRHRLPAAQVRCRRQIHRHVQRQPAILQNDDAVGEQDGLVDVVRDQQDRGIVDLRQPAERVAATEADVQLFWGEPLDGVAERIARLKALSRDLDRDLPPLQFGLRITTCIRDTTEQAWAEAEARVAEMSHNHPPDWNTARRAAVGQQRLLDLQSRGDVLDDNLYTAPGRFGGGGAGITWLVGSAEDVARSLRKYEALGITHFVLSDTPYLAEIHRQGEQLLPLLRQDKPAARVPEESRPPAFAK